MKYFAYGSNCNPAIMQRKAVEFTSRRRATLPGYRVLFNKRALRERLPEGIGFANINEHPGAVTEGILYEIADEHLERLDRSERHPAHYERIDVTVDTDEGPVACFTYRARPDKVASRLRPSRNYLNHILAARDFLSRQYYEALDQSQTFEATCAICAMVGEIVFIRDGAQMFMACQACREARLIWGDTRGRPLSVAEAKAVMDLVRENRGFDSIRELIDEAVAAKVIDP